MKYVLRIAVIFCMSCFLPATFVCAKEKSSDEIKLPPAKTKGEISLEETMARRRSIRRYQAKDLTREQVAQLLWSAQGVTARRGPVGRTVPSAGALHPMNVYLVNKDGVYQYLPQSHTLKLIKKGDLRSDLSAACLGQDCVKDASISLVITGDYQKCARKYRQRATRYVHIEAGHIGQNILLQAVALGLGAVPVGAFNDKAVVRVLNLPESDEPLYLIPVGYPK